MGSILTLYGIYFSHKADIQSNNAFEASNSTRDSIINLSEDLRDFIGKIRAEIHLASQIKPLKISIVSVLPAFGSVVYNKNEYEKIIDEIVNLLNDNKIELCLIFPDRTAVRYWLTNVYNIYVDEDSIKLTDFEKHQIIEDKLQFQDYFLYKLEKRISNKKKIDILRWNINELRNCESEKAILYNDRIEDNIIPFQFVVIEDEQNHYNDKAFVLYSGSSNFHLYSLLKNFHSDINELSKISKGYYFKNSNDKQIYIRLLNGFKNSLQSNLVDIDEKFKQSTYANFLRAIDKESQEGFDIILIHLDIERDNIPLEEYFPSIGVNLLASNLDMNNFSVLVIDPFFTKAYSEKYSLDNKVFDV
jgi:hypothetical protein